MDGRIDELYQPIFSTLKVKIISQGTHGLMNFLMKHASEQTHPVDLHPSTLPSVLRCTSTVQNNILTNKQYEHTKPTLLFLPTRLAKSTHQAYVLSVHRTSLCNLENSFVKRRIQRRAANRQAYPTSSPPRSIMMSTLYRCRNIHSYCSLGNVTFISVHLNPDVYRYLSRNDFTRADVWIISVLSVFIKILSTDICMMYFTLLG